MMLFLVFRIWKQRVEMGSWTNGCRWLQLYFLILALLCQKFGLFGSTCQETREASSKEGLMPLLDERIETDVILLKDTNFFFFFYFQTFLIVGFLIVARIISFIEKDTKIQGTGHKWNTKVSQSFLHSVFYRVLR